jgi:hypothetical protein
MSPLLSLRVRLTFSYTLTCALALALVVLVTSRLAFGILMHPLIEAVQQSADAARRVIAAHPDASLVVLEKAIVRAASRPDVSIIVIPNNGIHTAAPRQDVFKSLPESASRLGFQRVLISARDGTVFIAPDFRRVNPMIQGYITYVAASLLGAVLAAWLIARWITTQALNPLVLVTSELERFGNGDFSTRPVATGFDRSELGRLTTAYNAAASQVSAAFEERERVAHEMRTLLGDAGHALRTPLTVVTGFIDVLDGASFDDPRVRERAIRSMRIEKHAGCGCSWKVLCRWRAWSRRKTVHRRGSTSALLRKSRSSRSVRRAAATLRCAGRAALSFLPTRPKCTKPLSIWSKTPSNTGRGRRSRWTSLEITGSSSSGSATMDRGFPKATTRGSSSASSGANIVQP